MQDLKSEADRKASEVERLRAAEKFMTKGTGEGECQGCGYSYTPKEGDDEYPVPKGTRFEVQHTSALNHTEPQTSQLFCPLGCKRLCPSCCVNMVSHMDDSNT
jgi:Rubredoxin